MLVFIPFVESLNDPERMWAVMLSAFAAQRDDDIFLDSCCDITLGEEFFFEASVSGGR